MKIRFTVLVFSALMVVASLQFTSASSGSSGQVFYSINMPGNPFQQPDFQMMIKKDNENTQMSFANSAKFAAYTASFFSNPNIVYPNALNWNTDFGAFYWDRARGFACPVGMYGIIPYVSRGYTEGAAETLYMQRPAQITLPFLPIFKDNGSSIPIVATLPDYQDVFLSYTYTDFKAGYSNDSILPTKLGDQLPCWYNFCCVSYYTSAMTSLGALSYLALRKTPSFGYFNLYVWPENWVTIGIFSSSWGLEVWPASYTVVQGINWFSTSTGTSYKSNTPWFLSFSPIIAPGYNGVTDQMVTTVLPQGDLGGNFAGYLDTVNPQGSTTTYDGLSVESMNLFQVFAQNMQWFSKNTTNYQGQGASQLNLSPGQGVFSDAMQLAAIQADFVPNSGSSSNSSGSTSSTLPFYGSYGKGENLSELSVLLGSGVSYNNGLEPTTTPLIAQQPMLSKITTTNFTAAPYMKYIVTNAPENNVQLIYYFNGIATTSQMNVYLPLYFADPGTPLPVTPGTSVKTPGSQEIGWNYCPTTEAYKSYTGDELEVSLYPRYYNIKNATMKSFKNELSGMRSTAEESSQRIVF